MTENSVEERDVLSKMLYDEKNYMKHQNGKETIAHFLRHRRRNYQKRRETQVGRKANQSSHK